MLGEVDEHERRLMLRLRIRQVNRNNLDRRALLGGQRQLPLRLIRPVQDGLHTRCWCTEPEEVPQPEHVAGELEDLAYRLVAWKRFEEARSGLAIAKLEAADRGTAKQEQICHG